MLDKEIEIVQVYKTTALECKIKQRAREEEITCITCTAPVLQVQNKCS